MIIVLALALAIASQPPPTLEARVPTSTGVFAVAGVPDGRVPMVDGAPAPCRRKDRKLLMRGFAPTKHAGYRVATFAPGRCQSVGASLSNPVGDVRAEKVPALRPVAAGAEYLALAPASMLPTLGPLLTHRRSQSLRVEAVAVESVYHALSGGQPAPAALDAFVERAHQESGGSLRFVLLVGEARQRWSPDATIVSVPSRYLPKLGYGRTPYFGEPFYPSDDPLARVGDRRLAVGRLPVTTAAELERVVGKLIAYETKGLEGEWRRRVSVFTGPARYGKFADSVVEATGRHLLDHVIPYDYDLQFLFAKPDHTYAYPPPRLGEKLIETLNDGALIAAYVGHGQMESFDSIRFRGRRYQIGSVADADRVKAPAGNPLFISLACLTGAYDQGPHLRSIGEALAPTPHGPVGVFAGSRVVHPYTNGMYAQAFVTTFLRGRPPTIGEGFVQVKASADKFRSLLVEAVLDVDGDALLAEQHGLFNLLGDPATRLQYPTPLEVSVARRDGELEVSAQTRGQAIVTVETQRSTIRGSIVSWDEIVKMDLTKALDTMAANHKTAMDQVVSREERVLTGAPFRSRPKRAATPSRCW